VELDTIHLWVIVLLVINLVKIAQLSQLNVHLVLLDISNPELTVLPDVQLVNISILQANNACHAIQAVKLVQLKTSVHHAQIQIFNQFKVNVYNAFSHALLVQATAFVLHA
jgi:hypothetical protein